MNSTAHPAPEPHQPDTQPRRSIYYQYQVHPAWRPPAGEVPAAPVVIAGAGPIGMALALDLARYGVKCVLLEAQQQVSEGSRAIVFTRRSLAGGRATMTGVVVGVLILGIAENVMNLLNIQAFYQYVVRGMILLFAVLLDNLRSVSGIRR